MTLSHRNNEGFTLIEVCAAITIMMIGLLGMLQAINFAVGHDIRNQLRDEAVQIGEEQVNVLRLMDTDNDNLFKPVTTPVRKIRGVDKKFWVQRESTYLPYSGARKLSVTVRWSYKNISAAHYLHTVSK